MSLDDSAAPVTGQPAPRKRHVPLIVGLVLVVALGLVAAFTFIGGGDAPAEARLRLRAGHPDHRPGDGGPGRAGRRRRQRRRAVHRHRGHRRHGEGRRRLARATPTPSSPRSGSRTARPGRASSPRPAGPAPRSPKVLAQTPVGLIGGPAAKAPASWASALDGGSLAMADPSAEGASALALLAPYAEMKQTGETPQSIEQKTVPVAQTYGERAVAGSSNETDLSTIAASSTQLVPATEAAYLAARRSNDQLSLVAPKTGVADAAVPAHRREPRQRRHPRLGRRPVGPRRSRAHPLVHLQRRRRGHRRRRAARPRRRTAAQRDRPRRRHRSSRRWRRRRPTTRCASGACCRCRRASSRSSTCPAR